MGVRFAREYDEIVAEMTKAVPNIAGFYQFFSMEKEEWLDMSEQEQHECTKTMCDDIFFALGSQASIEVAGGLINYDNRKHVITVNNGNSVIAVIHLV